jgi:hypothetical protein
VTDRSNIARVLYNRPINKILRLVISLDVKTSRLCHNYGYDDQKDYNVGIYGNSHLLFLKKKKSDLEADSITMTNKLHLKNETVSILKVKQLAVFTDLRRIFPSS